MDAGAIQRNRVDVLVSGTQNTGGLVGFADNYSDIRYSSSRGSVTGSNRVGGMIGYFRQGTTADSYSLATVSGANDVGGMAGLTGYFSHTAFIDHRRGILSKCFSAGSVTGTGADVGGFTGRNRNAPEHYNQSVLSSFNAWDVQASGQTTSADDRAVGLNTSEMSQIANFPAWDFDKIWQIEAGQDYPSLRDLSVYSAVAPEAESLTNLVGSGTSVDPYLIGSVAELMAVSQGLDSHYRLVADLDLSDSMAWNNGQGWTPIGDINVPFTGSFDGAGHSLISLRINCPGIDKRGLFCELDDAQIQNINFVDIAVSGGYGNVGGVAAYSESSTLSDVSIQGRVNNSFGGAGGVVGTMEGSRIERCSADITLAGGNYSGGLVGEIGRGTSRDVIEQSYVVGQVHGAERVGGIVGYIDEADLIDCYSRASVAGINYVGGLAGWSGYVSTYSTRPGNIYRAYSTGTVVSEGARVGGLIGYVQEKRHWTGEYYEIGTYSDCFWDVETSGLPTSDGDGVVSRTTAQMNEQPTFGGFDFTSVWTINSTVNDGYPSLVNSTRHALSYETVVGGSITGPSEQIVAHGADGSVVTAVADIGYEFVQWSDGVLTAERQDLNVVAPISVTAQFAPIEYTITFDSAGGSTVEAASYGFGAVVTAPPEPTRANYIFAGWQPEIPETMPAMDLTLTADWMASAKIHSTIIDSELGGTPITSSGNYIVRDSMGSIHVTYRKNSYIYSNRSDDDGAHWLQRVRVDTNPNSSSPNTLAIDGADVLHLGFTFNVGSFYTRSNDRGASWANAVTLHDGGWGDWDFVPQIAVDSNGDLSVVYYTLYGWGYGNLPFNLVFKESDNSGATWTPREDLTSYAIDSGPYGAREQNYCLGADGWRFVGYTFNEDPVRDSGIPVRRLIYHDGTEWTEVQVSTTRHAVRAGGDMAVDSQGQLHLTWVEGSEVGGTNQLMYRRFDPATRQLTDIQTISVSTENPKNVTLGVYAGDTVVIAYDRHQVVNENVVFDGVYLRTSEDNFSSQRCVSTEPNANTPNLRSHTEFMHQTEKWDMIWVEFDESSSTKQLVYADVSELYYTLNYDAGPGGSIVGMSPQFVRFDDNGLEIEAEAEAGTEFYQWSDGSTTNPRLDENIQTDLTLTAFFRSTGGVDIDWYAEHGITPVEGQSWADLDAVDWLGKGMTLQDEFVAGTNPNDPASTFRPAAPKREADGSITLSWSSVPGRSYRVEWSSDLDQWNVLESSPGVVVQVPAAETGDSTSVNFDDPTAEPHSSAFFRIQVGN
jgi:hypothetical protein